MPNARHQPITRARVTIIALLALLVGCAVEEPSIERDSIGVARGEAVTPWDAAQSLLDAGNDAASAGDGRDDGHYDAPFDAGVPPAPSPPTQVVFTVTTLVQGGTYKPKNIGAIWVEDASGQWVKTLAVWASVRIRYLGKYLAANTTRDVTDAVTSATLHSHESHEVTWRLTDVRGEVVPDGTYTIWVEVTDHDGPGHAFSVEFSKSPRAQQLAPDEGEFFTGVELRYQ